MKRLRKTVQLSLNLSSPGDIPWLSEDDLALLADMSETLGPDDGEVCLVVVDDAYIQRVNARYRGKDQPTDVLSFSYLEDGKLVDGDAIAGEIYISHETLEKEAKDLGVSSRDMFLRLGVHGLMHIVGYDHETDDDASTMEAEERKMLERYLEPDVISALF